MKRTRNRRNRYKSILQRLKPVSRPIFILEMDEVMADLDPGMSRWRTDR